MQLNTKPLEITLSNFSGVILTIRAFILTRFSENYVLVQFVPCHMIVDKDESWLVDSSGGSVGNMVKIARV